jgi:nucleotide-binding universal stress UspA family protein
MSDREVRLSASGVPITTEVLVGYPVMTVADVAASIGCDLIVAGESGRPGPAGPGVNRLAAIAPCPVLLVPQYDPACRSAA